MDLSDRRPMMLLRPRAASGKKRAGLRQSIAERIREVRTVQEVLNLLVQSASSDSEELQLAAECRHELVSDQPSDEVLQQRIGISPGKLALALDHRSHRSLVHLLDQQRHRLHDMGPDLLERGQQDRNRRRLAEEVDLQTAVHREHLAYGELVDVAYRENGEHSHSRLDMYVLV